jgi:hypothetical protein
LERGALAALLVAGTAAAVLIVRARAAAGGTPGWDEASHGLQGFVILQDLGGLDFRSLYGDVLGTHFRYPFGHSVLLVPAYALFGATWTVAVGVGAALFAGLLLALFKAAKVASQPAPDVPSSAALPVAAGIFAALLALGSPVLVGQALTIMLEMPALVLGTMFLGLYAGALDRPEDSRRLSLAGWTLTAMVLTASQYATVWLFTLATFEAVRARPEDRRAVFGWLRGLLTPRTFLEPLTLASLGLFAIAIGVVVTGGGNLEIGPATISLVHPGTPLTLGLLAAAARAGWLIIQHRERLRGVVPARYRVLFASIVIPMAVWFFVLYPLRLTHYLNWVTQSTRPLPRSSLAFWTFYPQSLYQDGGLHPAWPLGVLAVVALGFLERGVPEKIRFLRWALVSTSLIVVLHSARQPRFIVPFLPIWIVLASATLARAARRIPASGIRCAVLGIAGGVVLATLAACGVTLFRERLPSLAEAAFTPDEFGYADVLRRVTGEALKRPSARILGTFSGLSHHLFEWELRRARDFRDRELAFDLGGDSGTPGRAREDADAAFARWLAGAPEERVFSLEPVDLAEQLPEATGPGGGVTRQAGLAMRLMGTTDRYRRAQEWLFPYAKLRVVEYDLVGDRPALHKRTKHRSDR